MDAHLKDRDIDKLVSGLASDGETRRAELHLRGCEPCRRKVSVLSGVIAVSPSEVIPGDHVKAAVLDEWHRMNSRITESPKKPVTVLRIAYGIAAAVIIAVSAYFAVTSLPYMNREGRLNLSSWKGDITVNGIPFRGPAMMREGDTILSGADSSVSVTSDGYKLEIGSMSSITLAANNSKKGFIFTLNKGEITSSSEGMHRYSFTCGRYNVSPSGTEFRLAYNGNRLTAEVFTGAVIIYGDGIRVEVPAGMKWDSDDPGTLSLHTAVEERTKADDAADRWKGETGKEPGTANPGDKPDDNINNRDTVIDPGEKRELKQEARDDINEMRREMRKGRQIRGGN